MTSTPRKLRHKRTVEAVRRWTDVNLVTFWNNPTRHKNGRITRGALATTDAIIDVAKERGVQLPCN